MLDNSRGMSKFQAKTIEAFMVGYGDRGNTYRCYDPKSGNVIITSDAYAASHTSTSAPANNVASQHTTFAIGNGSGETSQPRDESPPPPPRTTSVQREIPLVLEGTPAESARQQRMVEQPTALADDAVRRAHRPPPVGWTISSWPNQQDMSTATASAAAPARMLVPVVPPVSERASSPERASLPERAPEPDRRDGSSPRRQLDNTFIIRHADPQVTPRATRTPSGQVLIDWPQQVTVSRGGQRDGGLAAPAPTQSASGSVAGQARQTVARSNTTARRLLSRLSPIFTKSNNVDNARNLSAIAIQMDDEPQNYVEALSGSNANKWKIAIDNEFAAHKRNGTWELVPKPPNVNEITTKWIFKIKDDTLYKARLVARGFVQQAGVDYNEIFAPVVRMDSIRLLFSLSAQYGLKYKQFDVTAAFLHGDIEELLYLKPPQGLDVPDGYTCRLRKSLYGLKQAPRCWNAMLSSKLKQIGLQQTYADPCVYVRTDGEPVYLALYVDDGLVFSRDEAAINKVLEYIEGQFMVKRINSDRFLGLEIVHYNDGSLFLHQRRYIQRVIHKYNLQDAKGKATPMEVGHNLNKQETLNEPVVEDVPYAEAVGSLLYCAVATRPDISYALSVLSKYTAQPRQQHWLALKRVVRYLSETATHGLLYKRVAQPKIVCYTDADYAGDHESRRSISGMITFLASGPITYRAQQQSFVALSTTEAEYVAASLATRDLIWLQGFVKELRITLKQKASLLCDNQSALRLIRNPEFHQRSKHIDIIYHFVRERYLDGCFEIEYVGTEEQLADIFTKAFTVARFQSLRGSIGCVAPKKVDS